MYVRVRRHGRISWQDFYETWLELLRQAVITVMTADCGQSVLDCICLDDKVCYDTCL